MRKTYKTFGEKWYNESSDQNLEKYKEFRRELYKSIYRTNLTTVFFYRPIDLYKFMFESRVKKLFNDNPSFKEQFRSNYNPGFLGGYFANQVPALEHIIERTIKYPRSATAKALYNMIEEKEDKLNLIKMGDSLKMTDVTGKITRVKELFSDDVSFTKQFRSYYKPGFFGGFFANRVPTVDNVIARTIEHRQSATAKALYDMIDKKRTIGGSLRLTNGARTIITI